MVGFFKTYQWCPTVAEQTNEVKFRGMDTLAVRLIGTIDFPDLTKLIFYSSDSRDNIFYPDSKANTYKIKDLCMMANVNYTEIKEIGGVFELFMDWNCNADDEKCRPDFKVRFINQTNSVNPLGQPLGFFVESSLEYDDQREYNLKVAFKFNMISRGIAKSFNLYNLIIQVIKFKIFLYD